MKNNPPAKHDVRLKADGAIIADLEIQEAYDGERDKNTRNLTSEGGILFKTKAGKNLFMKFSEFAFVIRGLLTPSPV